MIQIPVHFSKEIEKFWPTNPDDEILLLKLIIEDDKLGYKFFAERAFKKLSYILDNAYTFNFVNFYTVINQLFTLQKDDVSKMIEYVYFYTHYDNENDLLFDIFENFKHQQKTQLKVDRYYSSTEKHNKLIKINDSYSRKISTIKQDSEVNQRLLSVTKELNIKYISTYLEFLILPSKNSLNKFLLALKNLENKKFLSFKRKIENWLLSHFLRNIEKTDDLTELIKSVNAENSKDFKIWQEMENSFLEYNLQTSFEKEIFYNYTTSSTSESYRYHNYDSFYKELIRTNEFFLYPNLRREFLLTFLMNSFPIRRNNNNEEVKFKQEYIKDLVFVLNKDFKKDELFSFNHFIVNSIIMNIDKPYLKKLIKNKEDNFFNTVSINLNYNTILFGDNNDENSDFLISCFNFSMNLDYESSLIRLIFLNYLTFENKIESIGLIEYDLLKSKSFLDVENEISKLFLLIIYQIYNKADIQESFDNLIKYYPNHKYISTHFIKIISKNWFDLMFYITSVNTFYELIKETESSDYTLLASFETTIKNKIESIPSGFNGDIIKDMELDIK